MDRRGIFFTSDLHIGHANSIKFDSRPFRDLDHMHEVLINNFNSTVPKNGITFILGDVGMSKVDGLKEVISKLNGTKVLVLGNHDAGVETMYKAGFDVVLTGAMLTIAGKKVTMSHCPLIGIYREDTSSMPGSSGENWHGETREKNRLLSMEDMGQYHLHGHIHSPNHGKSVKILDRQYDVGVVSNGYRPVPIKVIESWIASREHDIIKQK